MFTKLEKVCLGACIVGAILSVVGYGKTLGIFVSPPLFWGGTLACVISMHRRGYGKEEPDDSSQVVS
jgi:hypothetical protein